ncbi:MAG: helix-turn-helix domain-containing protein [Phycisphaerae bacterium]
MAKGKYEYWLSDDGLLLLEAWARDGLTDEQIAHNAGITTTTLYDWKNKYPTISYALKKGKEVVDIEVENALYKKALGYTVELRKTFKVRVIDYDPETGKRIREYEELRIGIDEIHVPADTTAQIFWLKNRKPNDWRDKKVMEHEGEINVASPRDEITRRITGIASRIGEGEATQ